MAPNSTGNGAGTMYALLLAHGFEINRYVTLIGDFGWLLHQSSNTQLSL
jgi:hypothetical protein